MRPSSPHALPIGTSQPPNDAHAVSVSLPTWHSIVSWSRREPWVVSQMKSGYPRLFISAIIQKLSAKVLERLQLNNDDHACTIMSSFSAAQRLIEALAAKDPDEFISPCIRFTYPNTKDKDGIEDGTRWATFYAVVHHSRMQQAALAFWRETGDGITSRHAEFALERFRSLESQCVDAAFRSKPVKALSNGCAKGNTAGNETRNGNEAAPVRMNITLPSPATTATEVAAIKSLIAKCAASEDPAQPLARQKDIFLYPKGLSGIFAVARSLVPHGLAAKDSQAVIYGWPYAETVKCVERSGWGNVILYGHGTAKDLNDLEARLNNGQRIQALFCELPSNPQLASPDLHRIRRLADKHGFVVACDETLGTFVNVDVLPFVDIAMTSLTKIFSGASNVMGGSVLLNPRSKYYDTLHARLDAEWEDILFPADISVLAANCGDFVERVKYCSHTAIAVAELLSRHPTVQKVHYPSLVPTRYLYDRYRRPDGGYGYVLSVVFHDPEVGVKFYDNLDVCKGTSIGANFTLAVPYAQLAHFRELDLAERNGVPKHIVRISVGCDDTEKLLARVRDALAAAVGVRDNDNRQDNGCSNGHDGHDGQNGHSG